MSSVQILYLLGAFPALFNPIYYTWTARWWKNREGRLFFAMLFLPFCLYAATVIFLLVPEGGAKDVIRFILVLVASSVSWGTLAVYWKIRKEGVERLRQALLQKEMENHRGGESDDLRS